MCGALAPQKDRGTYPEMIVRREQLINFVFYTSRTYNLREGQRQAQTISYLLAQHLRTLNRGCRKLTGRKPRLLLQVGLYLFQATALGLRHKGSDEDKGNDPDHGVSQEYRSRSQAGQQAGECLGDDEVCDPV